MFIYAILFLFLVLSFLVTSVSYASPFDSFESELKDYINSETYQYYDGDENQIKELFSKEIDGKQIENVKSVGNYSTTNSNYKLPDYIPVTRLISSKIIRPQKQVTDTYRVKPKDTLNSISRKFKTTVAKLQKTNGIRTHIIKVGTMLKIPRMKSVEGKKIVTFKVFAKPVVGARTTSSFGYRRDPFNPNRKNYHSGMDLSASVGTPVIAAADGVVEFKGRNGGYGNTIIIRHKNGYKTVYAHCATTTVEVGESVKMGKVIGSVGRTGTATGAHLHFEVIYKGKFVDPLKALNKVEVVVTKLSKNSASNLNKSPKIDEEVTNQSSQKDDDES